MKDGYVIKSKSNQAVSENDLELINKLTRRKFAAEEVYTFSVVLCDNEIDRDYEKFTDEALLKLNILLNTNLNGMPIGEISLGMITRMKQQAGTHSEIVANAIDAVAAAIKEEEDLEIYTSGATNIFRYPELSDNQKASEIISTFEEKQMLSALVQETLAREENTGIQVYIRNESPIGGMEDCSIVTATYELGEGMKGTVGIIGPKRMDYEKVVGTLKDLMGRLDDLYKKK